MPTVAFRLVHTQQIRRAEPVHHPLNAARFLQLVHSAFQLFYPARGSRHSHQMAAGRGSPGNELFWIELVFLCIGPQPADGPFAIIDLRWEFRLPTQAITDMRHGVALRCELQRGASAVLASTHPSSSMNPNDERKPFFSFFRKVKVKKHTVPAGLPIFQVSHDLYA